MDEIVKMIGLKNNCTFCGVFRRQVFISLFVSPTLLMLSVFALYLEDMSLGSINRCLQMIIWCLDDMFWGILPEKEKKKN